MPLNWEESRRNCKETGSDLVSIESAKEWFFLKTAIQSMKTAEYFIGLKKDSKSGEWRWISDKSKVDATRGKFPWAKYQPSGDGNCAIMYKNYRQDYGRFDDLNCAAVVPGYICESPANSSDRDGMHYKLSLFFSFFKCRSDENERVPDLLI